ncbi:MAG: hypothetical protein KDH88_12915 [Chromatiales bacterium]|nr:hypothetical protein [Chromatiales bacterium]
MSTQLSAVQRRTHRVYVVSRPHLRLVASGQNTPRTIPAKAGVTAPTGGLAFDGLAVPDTFPTCVSLPGGLSSTGLGFGLLRIQSPWSVTG